MRQRKCKDCGCDITQRFIAAKRCIDCAVKRQQRLAKPPPPPGKEGREMVKRICPECGAAFSPRYGSQVCCSDACKRARLHKLQEKYREERYGVSTPRKCVICGKEFLARSGSTHKTCSHECSVRHAKLSGRYGGDVVGGNSTRWVARRARKERLQREQARRIRFARLDALCPKPKIEIINRDGIIIERRGTVPAGCHAADFIRHS